jgi:hypothetical protein
MFQGFVPVLLEDGIQGFAAIFERSGGGSLAWSGWGQKAYGSDDGG